MEIRINNEIIDTRIEHERNAFEVMEQLNQWLLGEGFFISSLLVNGRASSPSDEEVLRGISVEELNTMEINALPLDELSFENFATLLNYFYYLHRTVRDGERELLADLMAESGPVLQSMDSILNLRVGDRPASELLIRLLDESGVAAGEPGDISRLEEFLKNLCIFIEGRIREIANPLLELQSTASLLAAQVPRLEEVPILLQTGKEREAMQMVIAFTELGEKLNRLYPLLTAREDEDLSSRTIRDLPFDSFYQELNGHLRELTEAIEAEDTIMIGDLLEYEIAPKLADLVEAIDRLPALADSAG